MAATTRSAGSDPVPDPKLTNWAGNFLYGSSSLLQASSVGETRTIIRNSNQLKILGTRHCFNNIADSKDRLLSLAPLNKIISLDSHQQTVTVEAGIRYGELAVYLNDKGFALHNLASLPHISVVGGCLTSTHGSGMHLGNLSTSVQALELITADGESIVFSRQQNEEAFSGAVVNLGGLGVVTQMTLGIQPSYQVSQYVFENLPLEQLEHHFDEIMSAGYSVSFFTDWRNRNFKEVWIKSRVGDSTSLEQQREFFGAKAATRNLHLTLEIPVENCTPQMGLAGPWHERLPHFRLGFTPSSGKELQSEYFVPREYSYAALMAIEKLHEKISPHLLVSEIRCIAADDLWMSPCYRQASTALHFTWKPDWPAVSKLLPLIEERLAPFHAKPHWGKLFTVPHRSLLALYQRMPDFQQLLLQYDSQGKFRNEYLDKVIFGN